MNESPEYLAALRQHEAQQKAEALVDSLTRFVNGMSREESDAFATALANDHPTLIGQVAKTVAIGVMRRVVYDPSWTPFTTTMRPGVPVCPNGASEHVVGQDVRLRLPGHAAHDGRLDCATVIGAELLARQSFI